MGRGWTGAVRGECGENVESFCLRGRSAYVGFSCLFLLAPVRGGTSFLFKREKKRSKETRFKPPIFKCRRCPLQVFGTNVAQPPNPPPAVEHPSQAPTARTRFASIAPIPFHRQHPQKVGGNVSNVTDKSLGFERTRFAFDWSGVCPTQCAVN